MSLHLNQIRVLEAINNRVFDEDKIAKTLDLSVEIVEYLLQTLKDEGFFESVTLDGYYLSSKGKVAITSPDQLLPSNKGTSNQTTVHAKSIGFVQGAGGNVSNFSQHIGENTEEINRLMFCLREIAQKFPEDQCENAFVHLDDLEEDLNKPESQKPQRIKARLTALLAIAISVGGMISQTTDFTNNVLELSEKLGFPIEVGQLP